LKSSANAATVPVAPAFSKTKSNRTYLFPGVGAG
jgi:hypothetical protein